MKQLLLLIFIITSTFSLDLELLGADFNRNELIDGSILTTLMGNVEFQYGDVNIKSDSTIWLRGDGVLRLGGSVVVTRFSQTLTCDSLLFTSGDKKFELRGNTQMIDSAREVTMQSEEADFYLDVDSLELRKDPVVYFWSSRDSDTVVVTGEPMHYLGESGTARVAKNITIDGPDLKAKANSGYYSEKNEQAELNGNAEAHYALSTLTGGLIRLFVTDERADSFTVIDEFPTGITRDTMGIDTTINELTGDSLHFTIDTNRIERVVSVGNSRMEKFHITDKSLSDILWGDRIVANIFTGGDGTSRSEGTARSLYRSDGDMQNEIAGDTLYMTFDSEGVTQMRLTGGVQGVILPLEPTEE